MSAIQSVLSWFPREDVAVLVLCLCTELLMLTVFVAWHLLFGRKAVKIEKPSVTPSWSIVVINPARSYTEYAVVPVGVDEKVLCADTGVAYVLEGPFYDLDKAIARRDDLAKKRP